MNTAVIASVLTTLGAVISAIQKARRWEGLRSEIAATRELAAGFEDDSPTRTKLLGLADAMSDRLIERRLDALNIKREWGSIGFAVLLAGASGFWAYQAPWLWLAIALWIVAGLFAISVLGMLMPSKKKPKAAKAASETDQPPSLRPAA